MYELSTTQKRLLPNVVSPTSQPDRMMVDGVTTGPNVENETDDCSSLFTTVPGQSRMLFEHLSEGWSKYGCQIHQDRRVDIVSQC